MISSLQGRNIFSKYYKRPCKIWNLFIESFFFIKVGKFQKQIYLFSFAQKMNEIVFFINETDDVKISIQISPVEIVKLLVNFKRSFGVIISTKKATKFL